MTLALLIMAVGGAWAEEKMVTINSSTMSSGAVTATGFNIMFDNLYVNKNPATITTSEGVITKLVIKKGDVYVDAFNEDNVGVTPGTITYGSDEITVTDINAESVTLSIKGNDFWSTSSVDVYTDDPAEWPLTSQDGKTWTLDKMPANDIELQVEYEPTKVKMAANDKTMGTVEVSGESKVEWTADTWNGWTADNKTYTVDDITMTSTNSAYILEITEAGDNLHSLYFFVNQEDNNSYVTFSTTGDPFSRIKFTMIGDYAEDKKINNRWHGNPVIMPKDNWTFSGKSAVWEGEATKSLTLQSCTTYVSKITFFKGGVPDGVTVNGDGTFTVAKTATVTLTATPAEGYKFLYWEDDQNNTNPVREVTIEPGEADKTYTAVFAEPTYNVTFVEGIEEADKWKAEPNAAAKNTEVKVTYSGAKKVLGVKVGKKVEAAVSLIVNPVVGQVICSDGKNYDANATLPDGVKAVAVIAYVGSETGDDTYKNGLAIALADEGSMNWSTAVSTCGAKTAITGAKWCLPSQDQWKQMFKANGGNDTKYAGLNTTITTAGGTTLKEVEFYWSSSEAESGVLAYRVILSEGDVILGNAGEDNDHYVRACLAF